jgi:hypothetical protein
MEAKLDLWLVAGAERFRRDAVLKHALLTVARHEQSRDCLLLLEAILDTPGLMPRLIEVLKPAVVPAIVPAASPDGSGDEVVQKNGREKADPKNRAGKKGIRVGR